MPEPITKVLFNQTSRQVRVLLLLAAIFATPSLFILPWVLYVRSAHGGSLPVDQQGWAIGGLVGLPIVFAMLVCAAAAAYSARLSNRALRAMHAGDYLVHWSYGPEVWKTFETEQSKTTPHAVLLLFICLMSLGVLYAWVIASGTIGLRQKALVVAGCVGLNAVVAGAIFGLILLYGRRRLRRIHKYPDAILSRHAMYCAGEVFAWDCGGLRLQQAVFVPAGASGGLAHVRITLGPSRAVAAATTIASVSTMAAAGRPTGTGNLQVVRSIPIPPGSEEQAKQVCLELQPPPKQAVHHSEVKPALVAPAPRANVQTPPRVLAPVPVRRRHPRSPRGWWIMAGLMIASGPAAFVLDVIYGLSRPRGTPTPTLDAIVTAGLLLSILGFGPLLAAIVLTVRHRKRAATAPEPRPGQ